jgi:hypothetical protein
MKEPFMKKILMAIIGLGLGTAAQVEAGEAIKFTGSIAPGQLSYLPDFKVNVVDPETGEPILNGGAPLTTTTWGGSITLDVDMKCTSRHGVCATHGLDGTTHPITFEGAFGPENFVGQGQSVDLFSGPRTYYFGDLDGDSIDDTFTVQQEAIWPFRTRIPGDGGSFLSPGLSYEKITDPLVSDIGPWWSDPSLDLVFACGIELFNEDECATGMFAGASGSVRFDFLYDDVLYDFVSGSVQGVIVLP